MLLTKTIQSGLLIFLILICTLSYSQQARFTLSGSVSDKSSGEPIENVNIKIKGTNKGTVSNAMGQFTIKYARLPLILEFSHVSYTNENIRYEYSPLNDVSIEMEPKTEPLIGITVTSQKIDTLFIDDVYSVLDYELCDTGILLLIYKSRLSRSELLLQDYDGNKLMELKVLPMKPLTLYKDCLDEIHIITKSQTYQVNIGNEQLSLYDPYELEHFKEVMEGCLFKIGDKVYFEDYEFYDLIKKYYYVNTTDTSAHFLTSVEDEEKLGFLYDNPENFMLPSKGVEPVMDNMTGLPGDANVLAGIRNMTIELRFNKMAYMSKIFAPIYAINDTIGIFNHPEDQIEFYNSSDSLIGTTEIDYHHIEKKDPLSTVIYAFAKSTKWLQEIYIDEEKNSAYTIFQNLSGTKDLKEIDLQTGELTFKLNIPFPYVQKIKVRSDNVYFVYRGFGEGQKKKLFRQRIY